MGGDVGKVVKTAVVAAAIATGVGLVLTPTLVAGATFAGMSGTLAYFAGSFAVNAALGAVGSALASKPEANTSLAELQGRTVMTKQSIVSRKIVYGEVKTSGAIVFLETTDDTQDLHVCVTLAGHEIQAVDSVFFNDQEVKTSLSDATEVSADTGTTPDYSSKASITAHFGSSTQTADSNLVSRTSFTSNHRLRGIAYLYAFLEYDQEVFANGLPNISAIVKGKKVFDPRTDTTAFSKNAALCIRDYLTDTTYGLGATTSEIDDDSFIAAANICDEDVNVLGGGTEKRYTMNGIVDTAKSPRAILEDMLTACNGSIYYSNGKWKIKVGAYVTPTQTLTVDELRGAIKLQTRNSGQDQFNAVKGVFVSPENNWQPTDFPEFTSEQFEADDGGDRQYVDVRFPFTTSVSTAQRIAKQMCFRNREQLLLTAPCNLKAFEYEVGDTVYVTNERLGFDEKPFEIISWTLSPEASDDGYIFGVDLVLKETSAAIYAWDEAVDEKQFEFNNTTLPNAFDLVAPGLNVSDELRTRNEEAISVLVCDVTTSSPFVTSFEVQARKSGDVDYINLGQATGNRFELLNVEDDATYEVRARSVNSFGVRSPFTSFSHQVVGKTAPPEDVTNFSGNVVNGSLALSWTPVGDLDLSHYRLRYASATTGVTYANAISLVDKIPRPGNSIVVPARTGTYFIKAVDKLGNASVNATTLVVTTNMSSVDDLEEVATIEEHPDWAGTYDDVVEREEDDSLVLQTSINFDDKTGLFDDAGGLFDGGGGAVDLEGTYGFANRFDFGAVYTVRVSVTGSVDRIDYVNTFDEATENFDNREGLFDGDPNAFDNHDVRLEVRTTDDDPTGSPTWSSYQRFVVGDYTCRAMEFRLVLSTTNTQSTPKVSAVTVKADMPFRTESQQDLTSGAGAYAVTFPKAFNATPAIGIAAVMQTGDYYEITSKTRTGFTITFKDSGGSAVSRVFDYVARGYGKEET